MSRAAELYNGIVLADEWPPRTIDRQSHQPLPVPYLDNSPPVIPIDVGRQLFVDDFLIESTTLQRNYHQAKQHEASPVLTPKTELELNRGHCPLAAPFNDGVWYDPVDGLFKLWYHAGWFGGTALAISSDGLNWKRPDFDVIPGTNAVLAPRRGYRRDGGIVWLDHEAGAAERYKMFLYFRHRGGEGGEVYTSRDGIHWGAPLPTSPCGDNSSFFYNPYRKRFVFSIRQGWPMRARAYYEDPDFHRAASWQDGAQVPWARADKLDQPDPLVGDEPQLYDLNAVAYESLMLGAHAVFYGPQNEVCAQTGRPKLIDVQMAYSRDGFHWHRPDRSAFIPCSRQFGTWNFGYIHAAGGLCLIVGDELWFYHAAFSGGSPKLKTGEMGSFVQDNLMYAGGSTGLAILRRDGFASMDAGEEEGVLLTRPLTFGGNHLFVNLDNPKGELCVDVLDEDEQGIAGFSSSCCHSVSANSTCHEVTWEGASDLSLLAGRSVRFKFRLRQGKLYAFWVSPTRAGRSGGFVAAGGQGFSGPRDV